MMMMMIDDDGLLALRASAFQQVGLQKSKITKTWMWNKYIYFCRESLTHTEHHWRCSNTLFLCVCTYLRVSMCIIICMRNRRITYWAPLEMFSNTFFLCVYIFACFYVHHHLYENRQMCRFFFIFKALSSHHVHLVLLHLLCGGIRLVQMLWNIKLVITLLPFAASTLIILFTEMLQISKKKI